MQTQTTAALSICEMCPTINNRYLVPGIFYTEVLNLVLRNSTRIQLAVLLNSCGSTVYLVSGYAYRLSPLPPVALGSIFGWCIGWCFAQGAFFLILGSSAPLSPIVRKRELTSYDGNRRGISRT